jgi:hypothetical protein
MSNNVHLGLEISNQLCTCRTESMKNTIATASTMTQIRNAGNFAVNYCEPIAKSYAELASQNQPNVSSASSLSNDYSSQLSSQRNRLLYEMAIRQMAESGATMRSLLSSNPYASSTFNSNGFNLSGIYPSGYSGVINEGAQRYRVQVTSPDTFTVSECRAIDCAY